jgi:lipopolysaccharide/colanic/teichoic acid biosynthesis glycosyltransferase/glycosyltransferase involved in cell wall biosynthesis
MLLGIIVFLLFLVVYHHIIYPKLLQFWPHSKAPEAATSVSAARIAVFICAHNEQEHIVDKLNNIASQTYPFPLIDVYVALDGCTDNTNELASAQASRLQQMQLCVHLVEFEQNIGKTKALNHLISNYAANYDIVVFSDVSALLSVDALSQTACAFESNQVAVITGIYQLYDYQSENQAAYWQYQNKIRLAESNLGHVIGTPGAFYAVRAKRLATVPDTIINDDFWISLTAQCMGDGGQTLAEINIVDMDSDPAQVDLARRVRLGAGNTQQLQLMGQVLKSANVKLMFNFFSGKFLRGLMPFILLMLVITSTIFLSQTMGFWLASGTVVVAMTGLMMVEKANYIVSSYSMAGLGMIKYLKGDFSRPWQREKSATPKAWVFILKRAFDLVGSITLLLICAPIMIITALLVKLTSKGPVIFAQLRVGESNDDVTKLFYVYKFRSMVQNAEAATGPTWASKNDARVTPLGRWLRKTRIDELPQLFNVLSGDMSLIGPRPERPEFYAKLEREIPFYRSRTYLLKPGISGLAQVMNGYDDDIDAARRKIGWDYAYMLATSSFATWLKMDLDIVIRTIRLVLTGQGR